MDGVEGLWREENDSILWMRNKQRLARDKEGKS